MNHKQNEKEYPSQLTDKEKKWLVNKPFGDKEESPERLRDFAHIIYIIKNLPQNSRILDIGVGSGWTSIFLTKMGYQVVGTDISPEMIKIAREKTETENLNTKFLVADSEELTFRNEFDAVLIYDTLHHCSNEDKVIRNCQRALKKGGKILIVEPNYYHQIDKRAQEIAKRFGVLEKGYTPFYLKRLLKRNGFINIKRYYAHSMVTRPYSSSFKDTLQQIFAPLSGRLFFGHFISQVWLYAEKDL